MIPFTGNVQNRQIYRNGEQISAGWGMGELSGDS